MVRLIAACIALASLSLLLPSEPSYDPWAWLVWARELTHLELDTYGGAGGEALTPDWFQLTAHGSEAPLAVALMLWAAERHLDGRPDHALALGVAVCLMRPELFPFLALYAVWMWRAQPGRRPVLAACMVAIPLAWVVPEWIGSGNPLDGG